jgi:hypothetical protein
MNATCKHAASPANCWPMSAERPPFLDFASWRSTRTSNSAMPPAEAIRMIELRLAQRGDQQDK